jgi:hypothetical protein
MEGEITEEDTGVADHPKVLKYSGVGTESATAPQ